MRRLPRFPLLASAAALVSGCSMQTFKTPDSTSNKGKKVTASLTHFSIFFITPAANLDQLVDDLSEQCGDGKVIGISMTQTRRYWYFFGESYSYEVAGRCEEPPQAR